MSVSKDIYRTYYHIVWNPSLEGKKGKKIFNIELKHIPTERFQKILFILHINYIIYYIKLELSLLSINHLGKLKGRFLSP